MLDVIKFIIQRLQIYGKDRDAPHHLAKVPKMASYLNDNKVMKP